MKVYLPRSWVLTDEHPKVAKGTPVLIHSETCKVYHPKDRIGAFSAQQVLSLAVEEMGKNNFLPEEIHFISRFKVGAQEGNRSVRPTWEIWEGLSKRK